MKKLNVLDFGAKGDGSSDDSTAIQRALDSAEPGVFVEVPGGRYLLGETVTVPPLVRLRGVGGPRLASSASAVVRVESPHDGRPVEGFFVLGEHDPDPPPGTRL